jgi:hypothetical protein
LKVALACWLLDPSCGSIDRDGNVDLRKHFTSIDGIYFVERELATENNWEISSKDSEVQIVFELSLRKVGGGRCGLTL